MSKQFRFTSRTKARKRAADVVFEADQRGMGSNPDVLRDLLRERRVITAALTPLPDYSIEIVEGVAHNLKKIDSLLEAHANVAGLDRIAAVDFAVMRVAVWEMLANGDEVSPIVAIDEAISIVKSISTNSSPNFVNAVLDAVRRELEAPAWSRRVSHDVVSDEELSEVDDASSDDMHAAAVDEEDSFSRDGEIRSVQSIAEDASRGPLFEEFSDEFVQEPHDAQMSDAVEPVSLQSDDQARYLTVDDISAADLEQLDELLDEY